MAYIDIFCYNHKKSLTKQFAICYNDTVREGKYSYLRFWGQISVIKITEMGCKNGLGITAFYLCV